MELLHLFATPAQHEQWLVPLLDGEIRSCFAHDRAGRRVVDPTNMADLDRRDGDGLRDRTAASGSTTGAIHPVLQVAIVMGVSTRGRCATPRSATR